MEHWARLAYESADAMLRERQTHDPVPVHPAASHTPATRGDDGLPPDVPQPDNGLATSGRGHHTQEPVAWAVYWFENRKPALVHANDKPSPHWNPPPRCVPLYEAPQLTLTDEERERFLTALADAIRRPMGVIPESAVGLVTQDDLDAAEKRRLK